MNDISSNIVVGSKIVDEVEDFPRLVTRVTEGRGKSDSRTNVGISILNKFIHIILLNKN